MDVRRTAVKLGLVLSVAMLAGAGPLATGATTATAADTPAASAKGDTTATLSAANREKLLASLKDQKKQIKAARKSAPPDAKAQAPFDAKIKDLNRLIVGLEKDQEFPMAEVNKALEPMH